MLQCLNVVKLRNGLRFDFYPGLPHVLQTVLVSFPDTLWGGLGTRLRNYMTNRISSVTQSQSSSVIDTHLVSQKVAWKVIKRLASSPGCGRIFAQHLLDTTFYPQCCSCEKRYQALMLNVKSVELCAKGCLFVLTLCQLRHLTCTRLFLPSWLPCLHSKARKPWNEAKKDAYQLHTSLSEEYSTRPHSQTPTQEPGNEAVFHSWLTSSSSKQN